MDMIGQRCKQSAAGLAGGLRAADDLWCRIRAVLVRQHPALLVILASLQLRGRRGAPLPTRPTDCMKTIQIRDVPDDVHEQLHRRAQEAGTSIVEFLRNELRAIAGQVPVSGVLRRAERRDGGVSADAVIAAVRSARESA